MRCARSRRARGGKITIVEHRNEVPGVTAQELADVERLNYVVDQSIVLHKYLGDYLPTKRGKGLDWTLGADAVRLGQKTGYDYALFLHAEDRRSPRAAGSRLACSGSPAASSAFARPMSAASSSSTMPRWSTSRPARWCGSTSSRRAARSPASSSATCGRRQGAAQMVDRLLGRMKPGRRRKGRVMHPIRGKRTDVPSLPRADPPLAAGRRRRSGGRAACRRRASARPAPGHGAAGRARLPARPSATKSACGRRWTGSRKRSPAPTC